MYLLGFADQFMWQVQQCIEKYLKATFLFGTALPEEGGPEIRSLVSYGHDLCRLLQDVQKIDPWYPEFPEAVRTFVEHVVDMGLNRYADRRVYRFGDEMPRLDEAVWEIRCWCRHCLRNPLEGLDVTAERWIELERGQMLNCTPGPHQHIGGLLESIIRGDSGGLWRDAREALLRWNRYFFVDEPSLDTPPRWSSSANPVWTRRWAKKPEIAALFRDLGLVPRNP